MPKKKEAVEAVEKAAKAVAETAKAAAETIAEKTDATVEAAKTAVKTRRTAKKAADAEKKAAEPAEAKIEAKIETKVVVELPEKSADVNALVARAKEDWTAKGNALADIKQLALYINAAEGMVYYVVNDDYLSGSFAI